MSNPFNFPTNPVGRPSLSSFSRFPVVQDLRGEDAHPHQTPIRRSQSEIDDDDTSSIASRRSKRHLPTKNNNRANAKKSNALNARKRKRSLTPPFSRGDRDESCSTNNYPSRPSSPVASGSTGQSSSAKSMNPMRTRTDLSTTPKIIIVLDTCVLLETQGLTFLESLTASFYDDLPAMQIHIPHVVLLELDRQKSKSNNSVQPKALAAIKFLHDEICDDISIATFGERKRIVGQTVRDYTLAQADFQQEVNDDHILFCCLQLQKRQEGKPADQASAIWCLTNDRNLRIRCVFNGIPAYDLTGLLDNVEKKRQGRLSIFDTTTGQRPAPGSSATDITLPSAVLRP